MHNTRAVHAPNALIVPHVGTCEGANARLVRLANYLGITCELLLLQPDVQNPAHYLEGACTNHNGCLVLDPRVIGHWTRGLLPDGFLEFLTTRFPFLLVHGITPDPFCDAMLSRLSTGRVRSVHRVAARSSTYEIASDMRAVCGPFSGLSFGPVNPSNDHVLALASIDADVRPIISIDNQPFMAATKHAASDIFLLGSLDTLDLDSNIAGQPLSEYFSQVIPHAMALRYIFGAQCWHSSDTFASLIVDDPLLRPKYGHLDFDALVALMAEHNFSTSIAFIPHNYRRNDERTLQVFRQYCDRLSLCFHGNDHSAAEFASSDVSRLNTMIRIAEARMGKHSASTGLPCGKVMVFPQGRFSVDAMRVLRAHNFLGAVNVGATPAGDRVSLTLAEIAQPAVLRHGGLPLFLRKYVGEVTRQDLAFNLFFGKPILIVEHHEIFKRVEALIEVVSMINRLAPNTKWRDLATIISNSSLKKMNSSGLCQFRCYSSSVQIRNDEDYPMHFVAEWCHPSGSPAVSQVLEDDAVDRPFEVVDSTMKVSATFGARSTRRYSLVYRNDYPAIERLGSWWDLRVFARRRLSEVRDNYISKSAVALSIAQAARRGLSSRVV